MHRKDSTTAGLYRGTVSAWKGSYGFIRCPEREHQVFCHFSAIDSQMEYRTLNAGQVVEFELAHGEKGPIAAHVKVICK